MVEWTNNLKEIGNKNYDCLLEMNISPYGKNSDDELIRTYLIAYLIHSKFAAIDQFASGIRSISKNILHCSNLTNMKKMLQYQQVDYDFNQMISLITFKQIADKENEEGSNKAENICECISEFELFLINVDTRQIMLEENRPLTYKDLLFFITGSDRIPPYGFGKNIDVVFSDMISLPKAHTCGLTLTVPADPTEMQNKLILAIRFGGGFGGI